MFVANPKELEMLNNIAYFIDGSISLAQRQDLNKWLEESELNVHLFAVLTAERNAEALRRIAGAFD